MEHMINNEVENTKQIVTLLLIKAYKMENPNNTLFDDVTNHIPDLPEINKDENAIAKILLDKIPNYGVKITPPDWLIYLIDICAGGNYGFAQLIYKDLLNYINNHNYDGAGIPKNYKITTPDFALCFPTTFPILLIPEVYEKYSKLWDKQKISRKTWKDPDNACDTAEFWLEVMEK